MTTKPKLYRPKVFIQGPGQVPYRLLWAEDGYQGAKTIEDADIVCFTGGADINPALYGEKPLPETRFSDDRDEEDLEAWAEATEYQKMLVGICRGAQFLNVLNGGTLWQDVDNHCVDHLAIAPSYDARPPKRFIVSSTHHQMMKRGENSELLLVAGMANNKKAQTDFWKRAVNPSLMDFHTDEECVWYPKTRSFCFQPHPEFTQERYNPMRQWFFNEVRNKYWASIMDVDKPPFELEKGCS